ncbi:Scr1 family TA system antitoxin-like transcriptional regulator [Streptomyces halstedii]|uniref:Scr1 family TA system antitoxin-like transcriptional regulator n=1 Tax=Streptomyces halstedii TaxID=1944 RepID=UPI0037CF6F81
MDPYGRPAPPAPAAAPRARGDGPLVCCWVRLALGRAAKPKRCWRQGILGESGAPAFWVILDVAVLRGSVDSRATVQEQMERLGHVVVVTRPAGCRLPGEFVRW